MKRSKLFLRIGCTAGALLLVVAAVAAWVIARNFQRHSARHDLLHLGIFYLNQAEKTEKETPGYLAEHGLPPFPPENGFRTDADGVPLDRWGTPCRAELRDDEKEFSILLWSAGPDREFGTEDDLRRREAWPPRRPPAPEVPREQPLPSKKTEEPSR